MLQRPVEDELWVSQRDAEGKKGGIRMSEEMDVRALEPPRYVEEPSDSKKVTLRIREFPGAAPVTVRVDPQWTVNDVERKYAKAEQKNPRSVRLTIDGQPLPKDTRIANLPSQILSGEQVIDAVPEHGVGRSTSAGLPDLDRIRVELGDLPYKRGYGRGFKASVKSADDEGVLRPYLYIMFECNWYKYQLDLSSYPAAISGRFVGAVPPCPIHGGKHPHVFADGTFCWEIERNWRPSMTLAGDYLLFIFKTLRFPQEHCGCRR
jgi:hypothetical protein